MEKYAERFSNTDYMSNIRSMASRSFQSDPDFWENIYMPVIYERAFNERDASDLRDTLIFLKFSCPFINVKNVLLYLEDVIEKLKSLKGYDSLSEEEKAEIRLRGKVPETEKAKIRKRVLLKEMAHRFDQSTFKGESVTTMEK